MRGLFLFQQADVSGLGIVFIILVFVGLFFLIRWALNSGKKENKEGNSVYDRNALPETAPASYAGLGEYGVGNRSQDREYSSTGKGDDDDEGEDREDAEFYESEDEDEELFDDDEDIILEEGEDDQFDEGLQPDSDQAAAQYMGAGAEETVELEDPALDTAETVEETPIQPTAAVLPFAASTAFDEPQSAETLNEADLIVDESEPDAAETDLESEIAAEASYEYVEPAAEVFEPDAEEPAAEEDVSSVFEEPAAEETTSFTEVVEAPVVEVETSDDEDLTEDEPEPAPASFETEESTPSFESEPDPVETASYEAPTSEPSSESPEASSSDSETSSESDGDDA